MVDCLKGFWMRGSDSYQVKQLKLWIGAQEFIVHFENTMGYYIRTATQEPAAEERLFAKFLLFRDALDFFRTSKVAR